MKQEREVTDEMVECVECGDENKHNMECQCGPLCLHCVCRVCDERVVVRMGVVCEHGSLARKCLVCELTEEIKELREENEKLNELLTALQETEYDDEEWLAEQRKLQSEEPDYGEQVTVSYPDGDDE